jgi:hypothetical protein
MKTTCIWEAPVAYPTDGQKYNWNETIKLGFNKYYLMSDSHQTSNRKKI